MELSPADAAAILRALDDAEHRYGIGPELHDRLVGCRDDDDLVAEVLTYVRRQKTYVEHRRIYPDDPLGYLTCHYATIDATLRGTHARPTIVQIALSRGLPFGPMIVCDAHRSDRDSYGNPRIWYPLDEIEKRLQGAAGPAEERTT